MYIPTDKNCEKCGCGLHPENGHCSHCGQKAEVEEELNIKLPDQVMCPYCKGTGSYEPWHNTITDEIESEVCDACQGTRWCDRDLANDFVEQEF